MRFSCPYVLQCGRSVSTWHDFAAELATMPDVIRKLAADHVADERGLCRACTTPGRGTPRVLWPCPMATLAAHAAGSGPMSPLPRP
jgi:hypothetical protein